MQVCFHIRKSPDQRSFASFPELIAGYNVLRRLSMPRHPPYTLSSLTTFIDHRLRHLVPQQGLWAFDVRWAQRTVQTINKGQIAKKVLDDIRSISPTKRLSWGSRQCRVNRILRTSRRIICLYRNLPQLQTDRGTGHSDEPFKPLNLTYSLVKELPDSFVP